MSKDFPGGPVDKTLYSSAGDAGSIPGHGTKIPHTLELKNENMKEKQWYKLKNKQTKKRKTKIDKQMRMWTQVLSALVFATLWYLAQSHCPSEFYSH